MSDSRFDMEGSGIELSFGDLPDGLNPPIRFGDIARISGGPTIVVTAPDQTCGLFDGYPLSEGWALSKKTHGGNYPVIQEIVLREPEIPASICEAIAPFRRGISFNGLHYDRGIHLLSTPEAYRAFETARWGELTTIAEGQSKKFRAISGDDFSKLSGDRDLIIGARLGPDLDGWHFFGPFNHSDAQTKIAELRRHHPTPKRIRKGVYRGGPNDLGKIEVFKRGKRIEDIHVLEGQGEGDPGPISPLSLYQTGQK